MEHPEQALFNEVKGLRTQMEEVRNRIFRIEATYNDKVENTEKREHKGKVVQQKLAQYKENLKTKKLILVDNQVVPLFRSTVENNIYPSCRFASFWDSPNTEVIMDMDIEYFYGLMDIVKKGHNFYNLDDEDKLSIVRKFKLRSKALEKDDVFNNLIKAYFPDPDILSLIIVDFNLNFKSVPTNLSELVQSVTGDIESCSHLSAHWMKTKEDFKKLTDVKNDKAIFLDYNKQAIIEFKTSVRVKSIGLKPFTKDTNVFYPTTGSYYAKLHVSFNGIDWDFIANMPSNYGSPDNDYVCVFQLGGYKSFKYVKIVTDGSSQFSLSHIDLVKSSN